MPSSAGMRGRTMRCAVARSNGRMPVSAASAAASSSALTPFSSDSTSSSLRNSFAIATCSLDHEGGEEGAQHPAVGARGRQGLAGRLHDLLDQLLLAVGGGEVARVL